MLNRPRREIITILILERNHYFLDLYETWKHEKANGQTSVVYPKLIAALLRLWEMIKYEYKASKKNDFEELNKKFETLETTIKLRNHDLKELVEPLQQYLMDSGVTKFVNLKSYDPMIPEDEDKHSGL